MNVRECRKRPLLDTEGLLFLRARTGKGNAARDAGRESGERE